MTMRRILCVAALLTATLTVAGCTSRIEGKAMVPELFAPGPQHAQPVAVQVSGGRESDPTGLPQISNEAFAEAVSTAITNAKLFASVVPAGGDASYVLKVNIAAVQQPLMGGTFTVTMETGWQIENLASKQVVWRKGVKSTGTASMGDAFAAITRIQLATERAARENIRQGLTLIAQLQL